MIGLLTRFLPGLAPGFGALLNPWIILILLAALAGAFLAGMHEQTIRQEAVQERIAAKIIEDGIAAKQHQQAENADIAGKLQTQLSKTKGELDAFRAKIPTSKLLANCGTVELATAPVGEPAEIRSPAAATAGENSDVRLRMSVRLTADGVREWNTALGLGIDAPKRRQFADAANTGAGPVAIADAIANLAENAAILGECRARELGWQVKACSNGWWSGHPCEDRISEYGKIP